MGILVIAAAAALISPAKVDFASPEVFVSKQARATIAAGGADELACVSLPARSRKYHSACMTEAEWQKATTQAELFKRRRHQSSEAINGLGQQPVPIQNSPYQAAYGPQ